MSEEILSQNQVEDLIRAMEAETAAAPKPKPSEKKEPAAKRNVAKKSSAPSNEPRLRTMNYDFKRPERVGKELMGAMRSLHEGLARTFNAKLSGMLRSISEVKLVSADQLTYSEFVYSLDSPTCFCVFDIKPLDGSWILDISPALAFGIVDRMLGGETQPGDAPKRPMTEIENRLISRVTQGFLEATKKAWENVMEIEPELRTIESNPQLVQIVPPNEVIVLICMEVTIGKSRGMVNLCVPYDTIERYSTQLASKGWGGYSSTPVTDESKRLVERRLDTAAVELTVTLARTKIKTGDLLSLDVGDVIATEHQVKKPIEVSIQSVPKFNASLGAHKGKKAVRIREYILPPSVEEASKTDEPKPNTVSNQANSVEVEKAAS